MKSANAILALLITVHAWACVDLSQVRFVARDAAPPDEEDAGATDSGASDASSSYSPEACRMCLESMCAPALDMCNANAKCNPFAVCMTDTNCWNKPIVDFNNPPACITACSSQAGIANQADPALGSVIGVLICAQGSCAPVCAPAYAL